jgi:hypothetical protein
VAQQLGHQDPAFTLRVYAHAMREEETDLSFAEALGSAATGHAQTSPDVSIRLRPPGADFETWAKSANSRVGRPGFEPGTNGLKARCSTG